METENDMSIERRSKLWSGPPIVLADPATERDQLIAANQAFAAALKKALQNGAETSAGVLATISAKRGRHGILLCKRHARGWGAYLPKGGSVGKENLEAGAQSPEHQGAEEFQRSLQSDDTVSYGKRLR